jgi:hypothetical protein
MHLNKKVSYIPLCTGAKRVKMIIQQFSSRPAKGGFGRVDKLAENQPFSGRFSP